MKTSFYFVIWILIYPILGFFHNSFIENNSFIIALIIVWGLSYFLNNAMPNILSYERRTNSYPILEKVYTGNVAGFYKSVSAQTTMSVISALYFVVATVVIIITFFSNFDDWIAVLLFVFFSYSSMKRSVECAKIKTALKQNPTPDECMNIAEHNMGLDYSSYYSRRQTLSYAEMFQPRPSGFKVFLIVSMIFALISAILGILSVIFGLISLFGGLGGHSFAYTAVGSMYFLYGSLAAFYGIKDVIDCFKQFKIK